ncbi:hypothetical protein [Rathayibacter rathayi]|nr:hypothetical protein [Rathayibacter rathayi]
MLKRSDARRLYERHGFRIERALEWDDILTAPPAPERRPRRPSAPPCS